MAERPTTQTRRCAVNPLIGREIEGMEVTPVLRPKKVLAARGGMAGLKAAVTAAQRGHQVILCEKTDMLGGVLKSEQAIPFKHEMYELGQTLERQARAEEVDIWLNTTVDPEYVEHEAPDALILAVGTTPIVPPLPGIEGDNVVVVNDYYKNKEKVKDTVVVLGGGLAGCECAVHLAQEVKQVHLVEMWDTLAPDCNIHCQMNRASKFRVRARCFVRANPGTILRSSSSIRCVSRLSLRRLTAVPSTRKCSTCHCNLRKF